MSTIDLSGAGGSGPSREMTNMNGGGGGGGAEVDAGGLTDNPTVNIVASTAKQAVERGVEEVRNFIEQNPSSIRIAVFGGALCSSIYCSLGIVNVFSLSFTPVEYMVNVYLLAFALITLILEGKPEWPLVLSLQEKIFNQAHFLSTIPGRAGFYIFQGTFGMARYEEDKLMAMFGLLFFSVGVLIIVQQYRARQKQQTTIANVPNETLLSRAPYQFASGSSSGP